MNTYKQIVVVGGGASGCLAALHCFQQMGEEIQLTIVDPATSLGYGRAYSTNDTEYILNVPVGNMSAFQEIPSDFESWVTRHDPEIKKSKYWPYVPRKYFGMYLAQCIGKIPSRCFSHIRAKAVSVSEVSGRYHLKLDNQSELKTDFLVVATGYLKDSVLKLNKDVAASGHIVQASAIEEPLASDLTGRVLIIGSGLTALDVWKRLRKKSAIQNFTFLSRRGLFPWVHETGHNHNFELPSFLTKTPRQALQLAREIKKSTHASWPAIAIKIRSHAGELWGFWSDRQKSQFLRHVKPFWEAIRHRMPEAIGDELTEDIKSQRARIVAGRIGKIQKSGSEFTVSCQPRKSKMENISANWIIIATGSVIDQTLFKESRIQNVNLCSYGYGFFNSGARNLWFVGPSSKSRHWEITAVPDIRVQAAAMAKAVANSPS